MSLDATLKLDLQKIESFYEESAKEDGLEDYLNIKKRFISELRNVADSKGFSKTDKFSQAHAIDILKGIEIRSSIRNFENMYFAYKKCDQVARCTAIGAIAMGALSFAVPMTGFLAIALVSTFAISACACAICHDSLPERKKNEANINRFDSLISKLEECRKQRLCHCYKDQEKAKAIDDAIEEVKSSPQYNAIREHVYYLRVKKTIEKVDKMRRQSLLDLLDWNPCS